MQLENYSGVYKNLVDEAKKMMEEIENQISKIIKRHKEQEDSYVDLKTIFQIFFMVYMAGNNDFVRHSSFEQCFFTWKEIKDKPCMPPQIFDEVSDVISLMAEYVDQRIKIEKFEKEFFKALPDFIIMEAENEALEKI